VTAAKDATSRAFAAEVAGDDPIVPAGLGTHADVGGAATGRTVRAPAGVVEHVPAEMVVRVRAGTPVADLQAALAPTGQRVRLEHGATVGGALGVGAGRNDVLEITAVLADGRLARAGGPVVKNVTGYDLCRLFVGSLGTLAVFAEVVLRTRPVPPASRWFTLPDAGTLARLWRPAAVRGGAVLLEGHPDDVDAQAAAHGLVECAEPPPEPLRWAPLDADAAVRTVHERVKHEFDPGGRLAPGRVLWR
jgi:glycolate oxidase FAD binding subunit